MEQGSSKVYETTLENAKEITGKRRDGNTVRLIDNAIQILFRGKVCVCLDYHEMGSNRRVNQDLFKQILYRLEREFNLDIKRVRIDRNKLEIELLPFEDWSD